MDSRQLEYVIAIAEEKSLLRASERCFVSSSALSQALNKLENSIGAPLFVRTKGGLIPTEIGSFYLDMAYDILNREQKTLKLIQKNVEGSRERFSIGVTTGRGTAMFSTVFPLFSKDYPKVSISLSDGTGHGVRSKLVSGEIDLAFLPGAFLSQNIESILLIRESIMLCVPKSHPLALNAHSDSTDSFPSIDLSLFRDEGFLLMDEASSVRNTTDRMCEEAGFQPKVSFEASSMVTLDDLSRNGYGIAFIHEFYATKENPLVTYYYTNPSGYSDLCVAFKKGYILSPAQKHFIDLARAYFRHEL